MYSTWVSPVRSGSESCFPPFLFILIIILRLRRMHAETLSVLAEMLRYRKLDSTNESSYDCLLCFLRLDHVEFRSSRQLARNMNLLGVRFWTQATLVRGLAGLKSNPAVC